LPSAVNLLARMEAILFKLLGNNIHAGVPESIGKATNTAGGLQTALARGLGEKRLAHSLLASTHGRVFSQEPPRREDQHGRLRF
jgi:hypothetical protein